MRFWLTQSHVTIDDGEGTPLTLPLAQWLEMEPAFEADPDATFEEWSLSQHYCIKDGNQQGTTLPSREEYCLKLAEYRAAIAPELDPLPDLPSPNWTEFRLALMVNTTFRDWAATLPVDWREDLKACAILANDEALQGTYTKLASIYPPEPSAAAEWQAIATANHIPVTFSDD